jgi:methylamine dehydrogenase heavy chain
VVQVVGVRVGIGSAVLAALLAAGARADVPLDPVGRVLEVPEPTPHRVWVSDFLLRRTTLVDADSGGFLGTLSAGTGVVAPHFSPDGNEVYLAETYYARATRGERVDVVTIYDARSLRPLHEIAIPPRRADDANWAADSALSDDGRFLAVFNLTPATSLSIVDLRERRFAGEIETPGCSLVYGAGPRRFLMICADGAALAVRVADDGSEAAKVRSGPFFDPDSDPVTEKAVRSGGRWWFVSFEGMVHPVDVSKDEIAFEDPWPLFGDGDRAESWRIGGAQHLAVHAASGRLYSLVHQGGKDTHKQAGTEVWVYDLERRERVQRIEVANPLTGFAARFLEIAGHGAGARLARWLLDVVLPHPGVDRIAVTRDEKPLLLAASGFPPTLSVHDARTGEYLRDVPEIGVAVSVLRTP